MFVLLETARNLFWFSLQKKCCDYEVMSPVLIGKNYLPLQQQKMLFPTCSCALIPKFFKRFVVWRDKHITRSGIREVENN
ncbi:Protein of unknown function [Gryllus bimaculatus]|nr:Protein of unknown function [Gryllus bimaculatus]